ncbi:MAG: bifunctional biotin--[acetyl-CoA-carboxylase] ligase/biotin operon repressor BirA [Lysobacterales bacterium]
MNDAVIRQLARYLSATETRSGEAIGNELGCSRTAVWKHVESLRALGIAVDAIAGQGYLLKEPLELLDRARILAGLAAPVRVKLRSLAIESSLDSTNAALRRLADDDQHAAVIIAEHQSGGRGRRGRQWHSPFGRNLYLSMGWMFEKALSELGCLPLVAALATSQALSRVGLSGQQVKWPNDLVLEGRKLCGCLVEVQGDSQGPCHAVLGVGINVHMPASATTGAIDQPWTDLHSRIPGCSRNTLAALLLEELVSALELFAEQGFTPFRDLWAQLDGLYGRIIEVETGHGPIHGTASGIDESGALKLDTGKEILRLHSGEVSLHKTNI